MIKISNMMNRNMQVHYCKQFSDCGTTILRLKYYLIKQGKVNKNFKPLILTPSPQNFSLILQNIKVDLNNFVTALPVFEKQR